MVAMVNCTLFVRGGKGKKMPTITIEKLNHGFKITDNAGHEEKYWWMERKEALMRFKRRYGYFNKRGIDIDDRSWEWMQRRKADENG